MNSKTYILVFLLILLTGCKNKEILSKKIFYRMDTIVEITFSHKSSLLPIKKKISEEKVFAVLDSFLADWEIRFSDKKNGSEVKIVNERSNDTVHVSHNLATMVKTGIEYGEILGGMFDITILPIKNLWGLGEGKNKRTTLPDYDSLTKVLSYVDYRKVHCDTVSDIIVFDSPNIKIDVGGIAKGVSLAKMGELLDNMGIENYLISAGGDIISKGVKPNGSNWIVGIRNPRGEGSLALFKMKDGTVVTSGDYERYEIIDGKRYCHIFDPHTGISSQKNMSLTIKGNNPVIADILSTGLFSTKADSIVMFIEKTNGIECAVIDSSMRLYISSGWKNEVKPLNYSVETRE